MTDHRFHDNDATGVDPSTTTLQQGADRLRGADIAALEQLVANAASEEQLARLRPAAAPRPPRIGAARARRWQTVVPVAAAFAASALIAGALLPGADDGKGGARGNFLSPGVSAAATMEHAALLVEGGPQFDRATGQWFTSSRAVVTQGGGVAPDDPFAYDRTWISSDGRLLEVQHVDFSKLGHGDLEVADPTVRVGYTLQDPKRGFESVEVEAGSDTLRGYDHSPESNSPTGVSNAREGGYPAGYLDELPADPATLATFLTPPGYDSKSCDKDSESLLAGPACRYFSEDERFDAVTISAIDLLLRAPIDAEHRAAAYRVLAERATGDAVKVTDELDRAGIALHFRDHQAVIGGRRETELVLDAKTGAVLQVRSTNTGEGFDKQQMGEWGDATVVLEQRWLATPKLENEVACGGEPAPCDALEVFERLATAARAHASELPVSRFHGDGVISTDMVPTKGSAAAVSVIPNP